MTYDKPEPLRKAKADPKRMQGSTAFVRTSAEGKLELSKGSVIGRRLWQYARDGERWRLTNIANVEQAYWPRGVNEADCRRWQSHSDRSASPHPSCGCGLYAFWDVAELEAQYHGSHASGIVEAWGRIRPGDEGFLAQYMMPVALDLPLCTWGVDGGSNVKVAERGTCRNGPKNAEGVGTPAAATWGWMTPTYTGEYPSYFDDPEGYAEAWEWVNCRGQLSWFCDEHAFAKTNVYDYAPPGGKLEDRLREKSNHDHFWVKAADVYRDLERYYECELLPGGEWLG